MKPAAHAATFLLLACCVFAQRPSDPALLIPQNAPALDYVPVADPIAIPAGVTTGASASVTFDKNGHLFVLYRGAQPVMEFDGDGKFIRSFGAGLFTRTHGIRIDNEGNFWIADVGSHTVTKLSPKGDVLLTIGTKGQSGVWDEAAGSHKLYEPNEVAIGRNGDVYIAQGHTPNKGDPRVLKFDKNGNFKKSWGGPGSGPGQFNVAHGIGIDAKGLIWVADRENQRIQVFDDEGKYIREMKYAGLPCGFQFGDKDIFMVNGFAGQILRLNLDGSVLAVMGKPGKGPAEFGEAHYIAVSPKGELFVADTVNGSVQKFVKK
jgi:DNA-binding beta-propeller fold protein YncE